MSTHCYSLICLGDSYTIGESVALHAGFPYQTIQLLRSAGLHFHAPEIIAKTGWTSFELADHLIKQQLNESYDFVSLLIGVNNQYRGLDLESFSEDLSFLIKKAIHLTGGNSKQVFLMSIPDWTITTFGHSNKKITQQIQLPLSMKFANYCQQKMAAILLTLQIIPIWRKKIRVYLPKMDCITVKNLMLIGQRN